MNKFFLFDGREMSISKENDTALRNEFPELTNLFVVVVTLRMSRMVKMGLPSVEMARNSVPVEGVASKEE